MSRILIASVIILASLVGGTVVQAFELPKPGLTPDSPFYFFDTIGKKINLFFTFSSEKKAEKASIRLGREFETMGMVDSQVFDSTIYPILYGPEVKCLKVFVNRKRNLGEIPNKRSFIQ